MEYAKWFIGLVSIVFIAVMCVFMFKLNEVNSFQQEVNYQIERNGGLTEEAKISLNNHAKKSYGGCIAESAEDATVCLFEDDRAAGTPSSGFFVNEFKVIGGQRQYYNRQDGDEARYGTKIEYAITRQIGNGRMLAEMTPAVIGSSASRVRGTGGN